MTEHTLGPWNIHKQEWDGANNMHAILRDDGDFIGEACGLANAQLIAAAPDLLEALKMIIMDDNAMDALWQHFDSMEMDKISAAIAKANAPTQPSESR